MPASAPAKPAPAETEEDSSPGTPVPYPWVSVGLGIGGAGVFLVLSLLLILQFLQNRPVDLRGATAALGGSVVQTLRNQGVPATAVQAAAPRLERRGDAFFYFTRIEAEVPDTLDAGALEHVIERSLFRDGIVISGAHDEGPARVLRLSYGGAEIGEVFLRAARAKPAAPEPETSTALQRRVPQPMTPGGNPFERSGARVEMRAWSPPTGSLVASNAVAAARLPRVAIIVDDGGYGGDSPGIILGLDPGLTLAILPYTPNGTELAGRAAALGFEVMLHMPMENESDRLRHEGQLNVGMTAEQIEQLTRAALAQVPGASGINNHMGSKFTADGSALRPFLGVVRDSGLFFVDSGTTAKSIAYQSASELGIPSAARTLFLDNDDDVNAIRARFYELMETVREEGEGIGICHFRSNTAAALRELLPLLPGMGVELVHASELVR